MTVRLCPERTETVSHVEVETSLTTECSAVVALQEVASMSPEWDAVIDTSYIISSRLGNEGNCRDLHTS